MANREHDHNFPNRLNTLSFTFRPSRDSNDHQVRVVIDGHDLIGDKALGLDPPEFFDQPAIATQGPLVIGRCTCGCLGCDDVTVDVTRSGDRVDWTDGRSGHLSFDAAIYDRVIAEARSDTSWEDANRTAERLVNDALDGMSISDEFLFTWASARIEKAIMSLCFMGPTQKILKIRWDGVSPASAVESARRFRARRR